ncbi:MAG: hypothetical protein R3A78_09000 [Polyangiales bacterium]
MALLLACAACGRPGSRAALLDVTEVGPARIGGNDALHVTGAGFDPGRDGTAELDGMVFAPGQKPRALQLKLDLRAISPTEAEAANTRPLASALSPRGTFHGNFTVHLEGHQPGTTIEGTLPGVVLSATPSESSDASGLRSSAEAVLTAAGFTVEPTAEDEGGVLVRTVAAGSRAALAGLRTDDVVAEVDDHVADDVEDFVPADGATAMRLTVERNSQRVAIQIDMGPSAIASSGAGWFDAGHELRWALLAFIAFLVLVTPFGRFYDPADVVGARSHGGYVRRMATAAGVGTAALLVPALHVIATPLHTAALLVICVATDPHILGVLRRSGSAWVGVGRGVASALPLVAASLITLLSVGRLDAGAVSESQSGGPLAWAMLQDPVLYLLFPWAFLGGRATHSGRVLDTVHAVARAALIALLFLGGWGIGGLGYLSFGALAAFISSFRLGRHTGGNTDGAYVAVVSVGAVVVAYAREMVGAETTGAAPALLVITALGFAAAAFRSRSAARGHTQLVASPLL